MIVANPENERIISIVSLWEIAIKLAKEKMRLSEPFDILIPEQLERNLITVLGLTLPHVALVATLPMHHTDPFDRILVAQALIEGLPIVSVDSRMDAFGVQRLW